MSGTSSDEDGDAGKMFPLACPGYRCHFGRGKPIPPKVNPLRHAGALTCSEQEAPCHPPVCQGGGKESKAAGGGGTAGELGEGLSDLWGTIGERNVFQVYGKGVDGGG